MRTGNVKWFNEIKGVGVIRDAGGGEYPFHFSAIAAEGFRTVCEGEAVEFEVTSGFSGERATRIRKVSGD
jgi:cold shock protein